MASIGTIRTSVQCNRSRTHNFQQESQQVISIGNLSRLLRLPASLCCTILLCFQKYKSLRSICQRSSLAECGADTTVCVACLVS